MNGDKAFSFQVIDFSANMHYNVIESLCNFFWKIH